MDDVIVIDEGEEERTFEYYLDLPEEMRTPIIDRMRTKERCRFAGTSKMNNKEAKSSKNYLYKLQLRGNYESSLLYIHYSNPYPDAYNFDGFNVRFNHRPNQKSVDLAMRDRWYMENRPPFYQTRYDNSINMLEFSIEHFKKLWKHYHKSIKSLDIFGDVFSEGLGTFDFGVSSFQNLQELAINTIYMEHILPKIRHPLKKLIIYEPTSDDSLANFEHIYQAQEELEFLYTGFTNEQLYRISAPIATVHIGVLTVENVYNFLRNWQDGALGRELRKIEWSVPRTSIFNYRELFQLFEDEMLNDRVYIKQSFERGKMGILREGFDGQQIIFLCGLI